MKQAIAIDIGTSKITVVQFDLFTMQVIQTLTEKNDSEVLHPDTRIHEQDPEKTWAVVKNLFTQLTFASQASFISIAAQVHGILLIDETGKPHTNLVTWRDARPLVAPADPIYKKSNGCLMQKGYGSNTLAILLKEGTLFLDSPLKVCTIASYILGKLSGCFSIDETIAATLGVFDIHKKEWNRKQLELMGIPLHFFPDVITSCTSVGKVLPQVAKEFGLSDSVLVYSPISDNQASFYASTGFCRAALVNIGTGGQLSIPGKRENASPSVEVRPLLGTEFIEVYASLCGGWAYVYLKDFCKDMLANFGMDVTDKQVYQTLDRLVLEAEPEHPLLVDTQFLGNRGGGEVYGSITEIDTHNFTLANLARGFLRGIVRELHTPSLSMEGIPFIVASGNAVRKNPPMVALLEEEFGLPVKISPFLDEAAIGSIFGCALQIGGEPFKQKIQAFYAKHFNL